MGDLLLLLEGAIAIRLQESRPDLYFLHAAVVELCGRAFLLVAPSGGGKSTTTWGLLQTGFSYASDELAPIDLTGLEVHPYPRALSLKSAPPAAYPLPRAAVRTSRGFIVPSDQLPGKVLAAPAPLAAILFLRYDHMAAEPTIRPLAPAEAAVRLYANALNSLAHPGDGLDAAIAIVKGAASFQLVTSDLRRTCALVAATLDEVAGGSHVAPATHQG